MKKTLLAIMIMFISFFLVACNKNNEPQQQQVEVYYIVTFNSDGGSNIENLTVKEHNKAIKPNNPIKINNDFIE